MKPVTKTILAGTLILAGTAFAKEGVQDPAVKARMELMGVIAANTKMLGEMAGGKATFNAQAAATAKANLAAAAAEIPAAWAASAGPARPAIRSTRTDSAATERHHAVVCVQQDVQAQGVVIHGHGLARPYDARRASPCLCIEPRHRLPDQGCKICRAAGIFGGRRHRADRAARPGRGGSGACGQGNQAEQRGGTHRGIL